MASSEILSQTLSSITSIKLEQLQKQKEAYESRKRSLLGKVAAETDSRKRAEALLEGIKGLPSMRENPMISVGNLKRFVEQAEYDPSVSEHFLQDYEATLRNDLDVQSNKYDFASLYGKLVNEWTSAGKADETASDGGFVPVGREEMHQQRATWEEYVFHAKETDGKAIRQYLESIFTDGSKDVKRAYTLLRESIKNFQKGFEEETHFDEHMLTTCIKGMVRSNGLSDEKRATLRDFLGNKVVLSEIADVLNMRMATRSTWCWDSPLIIEQRRNLNGRYRFHLEEDILHSIFIYYIGGRFAVHLRKALMDFVRPDGVWKPSTRPVTKADVRRRRYFLNEHEGNLSQTMENQRQKQFLREYFMDSLPVRMEETRGSYDDDESKDGDTRKGHVHVVQTLLRKIEAEVILRRKLGRDTVVIRSDFKWFGPSIPHSTIYAVLDFLGVEADWLDLFRRILEAPLQFRQDPADSAPQVRRRGTPLSTPLADFFGEALLFCLDFAVNQKADGALLYRLHDDMWMWGETETCAAGWKAMVEYAAVFGLDFNTEKTGCAHILAEPSKPAETRSDGGDDDKSSKKKKKKNGEDHDGLLLPEGAVSWGFLKLDPETGRFAIDQAEVDRHIGELGLQLGACRTVLDWIQAWNVYGVRFFTNNFGQPANCYGRAHVDSMLATFRRIQLALFPPGKVAGSAGGNAGEHLKGIIAERFGVRDLPDGYLYFPLELGGLGLRNPFVGLYLVSGQVVQDPEELVEKYLEDEEAEYRRLKAQFEGRGTETTAFDDSQWKDLKDEEFMGYDEYVRYRERTSFLLHSTYDRLVQVPGAMDVELRGEVKAALRSEEDWEDLSSYDKWVVQLFHKDMIKRFGGLAIVDKGLLPMGLMAMLRESRFKWQG